ncbi:hypothetical protein DCF38_10980 [Edwardsiella piscicida]|uniref:hypothetical protein n=1 Tax=Edwardsiella piscicida TaxID=1263550 RepID=UPI0010572FB0|nr:hypothetical protein [Edwardsiella piscicida]UCQ40060.1 hypothetical protein DCF38_10980 [Edwardsiella piscicida]
MSKYSISISQLAKDYGYDESSIRKNWVKKSGLDLSAPVPEIRAWIVKNILNPLRETNIREQIDRARLEKMQSEAELAKIEVSRALDQIIEIDILQSELGQYFTNIKNMIRSIPDQCYLELFESDSPAGLKIMLKNKIDQKLMEIGNMTYEELTTNEETDNSTESSDSKPEATKTAETS